MLTTNEVEIIRNLNPLQPQLHKAEGRKMLDEKMMEKRNYSRFIENRDGLNRRDEP